MANLYRNTGKVTAHLDCDALVILVADPTVAIVDVGHQLVVGPHTMRVDVGQQVKNLEVKWHKSRVSSYAIHM